MEKKKGMAYYIEDRFVFVPEVSKFGTLPNRGKRVLMMQSSDGMVECIERAHKRNKAEHVCDVPGGCLFKTKRNDVVLNIMLKNKAQCNKMEIIRQLRVVFNNIVKEMNK